MLMRSWGAALRKRWRPIAHWAVVGVALGYLASQAPAMARDIAQAGGPLAHLRWEWLILAVLTGLGALALYGEMHRQLLLVGGARLSVPTVQGITFAENAISSTVPVVGGAGALVYAIDQLRRHGVDVALASWSVLVAGVLDTLALLVLAILGLGWTDRVPIVAAVVGVALISLGAAACWIMLTHPALLRRAMHVLLVLSRRIPGVCRTCRSAWTQRAERAAGRLSTRIALLQPDRRRWLMLIVLVTFSWILDFLTLTTTAIAVGSPVPVGVLLVGFLVVQGSIALQIFPGGAGLAATGLLGVLLASGVPTAAAAATTVVYRAISWLGLALLGWVVYGTRIHTSPIHLHRHAPEHA